MSYNQIKEGGKGSTSINQETLFSYLELYKQSVKILNNVKDDSNKEIVNLWLSELDKLIADADTDTLDNLLTLTRFGLNPILKSSLKFSDKNFDEQPFGLMSYDGIREADLTELSFHDSVRPDLMVYKLIELGVCYFNDFKEIQSIRDAAEKILLTTLDKLIKLPENSRIIRVTEEAELVSLHKISNNYGNNNNPVELTSLENFTPYLIEIKTPDNSTKKLRITINKGKLNISED